MSLLPNAAAAFIADHKVRDYLLNPDNPQNQGKSGQFGQYGFTRQEWQALAACLQAHPMRNQVARAVISAHGIKYVVTCTMQTPDGRDPCLTSVWIIDNGQDRPRLVTAY